VAERDFADVEPRKGPGVGHGGAFDVGRGAGRAKQVLSVFDRAGGHGVAERIEIDTTVRARRVA